MMDALLTTALVGTARRDQANTATTGTPVDALLHGQDAPTTERRLLLLSGALATYRLAGYVPATLAEALEPAPAETRQPCTPGAAALVRQLAEGGRGEYVALLREVFTRLDAAGQRVPVALLPLLLDRLDRNLQAVAVPALGERALWLARQNRRWAWLVDERAIEGDLSLTQLEAIWQEGPPAQRLTVLNRVRASDPALARTWIEAVWKQEKADFRADMLKALYENLSNEDEALLESALSDRGTNVRTQAQLLLQRLPASAWHARMAERADALLTLEGGAFVVTLPASLEKSWERDGIEAKPTSSGVGERTWWLAQALAHVSLAHWEERFGLTPEQLVAAAVANREYGPTLMEAWVTYAANDYATNFTTEAWVTALWDALPRLKGASKDTVRTLRSTLARRLPAPLALGYARDLIAGREVPSGVEWSLLKDALPQPWPADLAQAYLAGLRTFTQKPLTSKNYQQEPWWVSLPEAALSLPVASFAAALQPWEMQSGEKQLQNWYVGHWRSMLENFTDLVKLRQRIRHEIPLPQDTNA